MEGRGSGPRISRPFLGAGRLVSGRGRARTSPISIQEEGQTLDKEVPLRTDFTIKVSSLVLKLGPVSLSIVDVLPDPMREEAFGTVQPLECA